MKRQILIIRPGDDCWVGSRKDAIPGKVVEVSIKAATGCEFSIQFRVIWWDGRTRKSEWLEDIEVEPISPNGPFQPVGFHGGVA